MLDGRDLSPGVSWKFPCRLERAACRTVLVACHRPHVDSVSCQTSKQFRVASGIAYQQRRRMVDGQFPSDVRSLSCQGRFAQSLKIPV